MVVLDPDEWLESAIAGLGEEDANQALITKVSAYQAEYDEAIANGTYKTLAQKKAEYEASTEYIIQQANITAHIVVQQAKTQSFTDNLPSWAVIGGKFDTMLADATAATNLAQAKAVLIELINVQKKWHGCFTGAFVIPRSRYDSTA